MSEFSKIFKKVNGTQQLKQYAKSGVLFFALLETAILGFSKKSLEIVRLAVNHRIYRRLKKKNQKFIAEYVQSHANEVVEKRHEKKIWIAWFQGMEQAPDVVKKCYKSIRDRFTDYEIVVITDENYADYVTFPDYIMEKYQKGIITKTHFSDLLRIELLSKYGGTWMDATVFCSGGSIPAYMTDSDLFMFQTLKPGLDGHCIAVSSWFITAASDHKIIRLVRTLLYHYWEKANSMVDYFLVHDFFQMAIETYPEEWKQVVPFSNSVPHILLLRLFEKYDQDMYDAVTGMTPIHKMSYKFSEEQMAKEGTYYSKLFKK